MENFFKEPVKRIAFVSAGTRASFPLPQGEYYPISSPKLCNNDTVDIQGIISRRAVCVCVCAKYCLLNAHRDIVPHNFYFVLKSGLHQHSSSSGFLKRIVLHCASCNCMLHNLEAFWLASKGCHKPL